MELEGGPDFEWLQNWSYGLQTLGPGSSWPFLNFARSAGPLEHVLWSPHTPPPLPPPFPALITLCRHPDFARPFSPRSEFQDPRKLLLAAGGDPGWRGLAVRCDSDPPPRAPPPLDFARLHGCCCCCCLG